MKRKLEYFLFLLVRYSAIFMPVIVLSGIFAGGLYTYSGVILVFGFYFLVELILWATGLGLTTKTEDEFMYVNPKAPSWSDRYGVAFYGVMQIVGLPLGILLLQKLTTFESVGGALSLSIMAGSVGGLAGHEYIHRRNAWEKFLGILVYGSVCYWHFTVSHLKGHHKNVGQSYDWSTSFKNESSYHFLWRALVHGYRGAWALDSLKKRFMILTSVVQILIWTAIAVFFGVKTLALYIAVSILAVILMEMVNYLSHYGLVRNGREAVSNKHSWESNNKVTNWFIFNAGKHCHHHRKPTAPHYDLVLANEKAYLPYGLPLMTIIAFVPPLYFRVMNEKL